MHLTATVAILLVVVAAALFSPRVAGAKSCKTSCPIANKPVCGTYYRQNGRGFISCTFDSFCQLDARQCTAGENWLSISGRCGTENPDCTKIKSGVPVGVAQTTTTKKPSKFSFQNLFGRKNSS